MHRVARALSTQVESLNLRSASRAVPQPGHFDARPWIHRDSGVAPEPYLQAAERVLAGRYDFFALRDVQLGSPPAWNRDPKTGVDAPASVGKWLDYRRPELVGNIKYLWELNRHLHLVPLAQAYALSGESRYFEGLRAHLESWFDACPCGIGPNWSSALEAGIRLINWSISWQLLGGDTAPVFQSEDGARLRARWLASVYEHARFINGYYSLYSSANNHLIGEAAGVFVAALTWPAWPELRGPWCDSALEILEREALLQNAPDGVNREQAVSYQQFVFDFLLYAWLAAIPNGRRFSGEFELRLKAMLIYIGSIMDAGGNVPLAGDSDDALVAMLSQESNFSPWRSLLASGALLFQSPGFKRKAVTLDDKTRWLLGKEADRAFKVLPDAASDPALPRRSFPDGGVYVLGCDFDSAREIRVVADAGPLEYRSIAAHGHADALSFTLSIGGLPILIDPGTYAYHGPALWRDYFRGTAAHNTLRVDGLDQSEPGGNFMWLRKARSHSRLWLSGAEGDTFEAWHDGYRRLPDPVTHSRRITLDARRRRIEIRDRVTMTGEHLIELFFHCDKDCRVRPIEGGFVITRDATEVRLLLPHMSEARIEWHQGGLSPMAGWQSDRFDEKHATATLIWRARVNGETLLRTEIMC